MSIFKFRQIERSPEESGELFKAIFDASSVGIALVDSKGRLVKSNHALQEVLGHTAEELRSMVFTEFTLPDNVASDVKLFKEFLTGKRNSYHAERRYIRKDGRLGWVRVTASLLLYPCNTTQFAIGMVEDITEQKTTEEFNKTVFDNINDSISIIDVSNFKIIRVNKTFLEEFRLKEEDAIGKPCYEITHRRPNRCTGPDDICPISEIVETGNTKVVEHAHYTDKGEKKYVEVSAYPITDDNGNVIQVIHISKDITERKETENQLLESQKVLLKNHEELSALFKVVHIAKKEWELTMDCIGDMVILVDEEGKIKRCNRAVVEFGGKQYTEILGKDWRELMFENKTETGILSDYGLEQEFRRSELKIGVRD